MVSILKMPKQIMDRFVLESNESDEMGNKRSLNSPFLFQFVWSVFNAFGAATMWCVCVCVWICNVHIHRRSHTANALSCMNAIEAILRLDECTQLMLCWMWLYTLHTVDGTCAVAIRFHRDPSALDSLVLPLEVFPLSLLWANVLGLLFVCRQHLLVSIIRLRLERAALFSCFPLFD